MQLLDQGFDEVIWIDSDVIVTQNLLPIFAKLDRETVVVTEHTLAEERDCSLINTRTRNGWYGKNGLLTCSEIKTY